ncbi:rRNA processing protein [Niveomyces insectorum RCEF 264]|uniref:rRNA processing protein n=1 Tax=Niveomyces insectorum RCEF 264 TaxID=1081102 RepID=A0A167M6A2_9HYPO|nr:rRNA processing protein [Niveomyces insectorum RCEF 264]
MGRSKLKVILATEKGTDVKRLQDKKRHKLALKQQAKKRSSSAGLLDDGVLFEDDGEDKEDDEDDDGGENNALIDIEASESSNEENGNDNDSDGHEIDFIAAMDDSDDSDSDVEMEAKTVTLSETIPIPAARPVSETTSRRNKKKDTGGNKGYENGEREFGNDGDKEDGEDGEIAWSDLDEEARAGLAVRARPTINNTAALTAALARIRTLQSDTFATGTLPFAFHMSITSAVPTADTIPDVQDDVARELQLYRQSRAAAVTAHRRLRQEGVPFARPADYFAEMVKDDEHMLEVRARLVQAASAKKASAEARKQRDLKKFGKQVQVAKLQERAHAKRETLAKIKTLKRKRQETGATNTHEADLFDVAVDHELSATTSPNKRPSGVFPLSSSRSNYHTPNAKRQKKNEKYGFGGKKRHAKSGDAFSSGDLSGFNPKLMKSSSGGRSGGSKAARPGKARRKAAAGRT